MIDVVKSFLVLFLLAAVQVQAADTPARRARAAAFAGGPLSFSHKKVARIGRAETDQPQESTLTPVLADGVLVGLDAVISLASKTVRGRIRVDDAGAFSTDLAGLVNLCNVGAVTPAARDTMLAGKSVTLASRLEVMGKVLEATTLHEPQGKGDRDGTMWVKSTTTTPDGRTSFVAVTKLAPDGLPEVSGAEGKVARGFIRVEVSLRLARVRK